MRRPTIGCYPQIEPQLRQNLNQLLQNAPDRDLTPELAIAPHGSLRDSGSVAASVYNSIDFSQYRNAVILGAKHRKIGSNRAVSLKTWQTPLGDTTVDESFANQLLPQGLFEHNEQAHRHETSIEMQLLFLQQCWEDFSITPLLIGNDLTDEEHTKTVEALQSALTPSDLLIVGTDLVHYGLDAYHPDTDNPEREVIKQDSAVINSLKQYDLTALKKQAEKFHICGKEPLLVAMEVIGEQELCHVLGHTTSGTNNNAGDEIIGYAGICYT